MYNVYLWKWVLAFFFQIVSLLFLCVRQWGNVIVIVICKC